jgi:hypothetical protein
MLFFVTLWRADLVKLTITISVLGIGGKQPGYVHDVADLSPCSPSESDGCKEKEIKNDRLQEFQRQESARPFSDVVE